MSIFDWAKENKFKVSAMIGKVDSDSLGQRVQSLSGGDGYGMNTKIVSEGYIIKEV